jgi:hypothetical protein
MPKNPQPVKLEQRGRIIAEGKESINFWIRAFRLEDQVTTIHQELLAEDPGTLANMSISSEYRVSPDLIYIYLLCPIIDMVGVCDGTGLVYYTSPRFEKEAYQSRDKFTDLTIEEGKRRGLLRKIRITKPGKE